MTIDQYTYAFEDGVDDTTREILITVPGRWGRMPPLSRAVVVEAGKLLRQKNLLTEGLNQAEAGRTIGLIGGTRLGSHTTDLAFAATLKEDVTLASPAIFGYTLANIPLAETANQFGLIGPVYAVIDHAEPLQKAREEARRLLKTQKNLDLMLACSFDSYYHKEEKEQLSVTFTLIDKNDVTDQQHPVCA
jgi:hypothetical protein